MTLETIYNLCNYISGKELTGNAFTLDQFNLIINSTQAEIKAEELDALLALKIKADQHALSEYINSWMLKPFVKQKSLIVTPVDGYAVIPDDYERYVSAFSMYNDVFRPIDIVDTETFNIRRASVNYQPEVHPFGEIIDTKINLIPYDIGCQLTYIRKSAIPFQDYCQDAITLEVIFMPAGSYIDKDPNDSSVYILYDYLNNIINNSILSSHDLHLLPFNSLTKELEFEDWTHFKFISRILSKVGVNLSEQGVSQYAETKIKEGK